MKKPIFTVRELVVCAMLVAIFVAQTFLPDITQTFRFSLEFIPLAIAGYLFGAIPAMCVGLVGDVVGTVLGNAKEFNIFFTVIYIIGGLIFGLILHNRKKLWHIITASATYAIVVDFLLTTIALYLQYHIPFATAIPRLIKAGIVAVAMPIVIFILIRVIDKVYKRKTV